MTRTESDVPLKCSPFQALLQNGIDRLFELHSIEDFTFVVKDEKLKDMPT
jgi:hypothetical protein